MIGLENDPSTVLASLHKSVSMRLRLDAVTILTKHLKVLDHSQESVTVLLHLLWLLSRPNICSEKDSYLPK